MRFVRPAGAYAHVALHLLCLCRCAAQRGGYEYEMCEGLDQHFCWPLHWPFILFAFSLATARYTNTGDSMLLTSSHATTARATYMQTCSPAWMAMSTRCVRLWSRRTRPSRRRVGGAVWILTTSASTHGKPFGDTVLSGAMHGVAASQCRGWCFWSWFLSSCV